MSTRENSTSLPRPDWVMCGTPGPGGVRLSRRFTLTAEMRVFTVIDAPDYPAAFKSLFEGWTPEPAARRPLGEGLREIAP